MERHAARAPGQGHRVRDLGLDLGGIDQTTEAAVFSVMIPDRALVRARRDEQWTVLQIHVVEHHTHGQDVVVRVRIKGPVLVPLDRRSVPGRLHVELGAMQAQGGAEQKREDLHHIMATHDGIKSRMHLVGRLDASDLRLSPGVPGLEIVDGGVRVDRGGACDQLGDDLTQLGQLRRSEQVGDHNEPVTLICVPQGIAGHVFPLLHARSGLAYGWRSRGAIVAL